MAVMLCITLVLDTEAGSGTANKGPQARPKSLQAAVGEGVVLVTSEFLNHLEPYFTQRQRPGHWSFCPSEEKKAHLLDA